MRNKKSKNSVNFRRLLPRKTYNNFSTHRHHRARCRGLVSREPTAHRLHAQAEISGVLYGCTQVGSVEVRYGYSLAGIDHDTAI